MYVYIIVRRSFLPSSTMSPTNILAMDATAIVDVSFNAPVPCPFSSVRTKVGAALSRISCAPSDRWTGEPTERARSAGGGAAARFATWYGQQAGGKAGIRMCVGVSIGNGGGGGGGGGLCGTEESISL